MEQPSLQFATVAQLVEPVLRKHLVVGSSPISSSKNLILKSSERVARPAEGVGPCYKITSKPRIFEEKC